MSRAATRAACRDEGAALLAVLIILLVLASSSASFVWLMNQQQTRAGARLRSAAAMAAAEAGVHRALAILEGTIPGGQAPGRTWRPAAYTEPRPAGSLAGQFTLSVADDSDGAVIVTSTGEAGGISRRVRARVYLASPALLAAVYGAGTVYLERPPAAVVVLPYGGGIGDRPWIHVAAGQGVIFGGADVAINDASTVFAAGPGPMDAPDSAGSSATSASVNPTAVRAPGPVRILLARDAELMVGPDRRRVDLQQLRAMGIHIEGVVLRTEGLPDLPEVDRDYYQGLAADNIANADLNTAAGRYFGDGALIRKRDSLYAWMDFERLRLYLRAERLAGPLRGVIYVKGGGVSLYDGQRLQIRDGALVSESSVYLGPGVALEITHSAATRTLPGLLVLDRGTLIVTRQATLRVHGLVYVNQSVDVGTEARADIVGAVLANHPEFSFRSFGASTVVRYDPAVLGTPGLRVGLDAPVVAWIAAWEEEPP